MIDATLKDQTFEVKTGERPQIVLMRRLGGQWTVPFASTDRK